MLNGTLRMSDTTEFSQKERLYFKKMFDLFDTDKSCAIGFFEMKNLSKHLGVELSDDLLKKSIAQIDVDGNGVLDFNEFLMWLKSAQTSGDDEFASLKAKIRAQGSRNLTNKQIEQLKEVFTHFDTDGSGSIDMSELGAVFSAMGQNLSPEELQSLIAQVDDDGSGEIEFPEFMLLMCSTYGNQKTFDQEMLEEFQRKDPNLTGIITTVELRAMIVELCGTYLTEQEVHDVVTSADDRGDGTVEYMKWEALWEACQTEGYQ